MGAVSILLVLLSGLAINNENAEVKVTSLEGFKDAVVQTFDEVKAQDTFTSFELND